MPGKKHIFYNVYFGIFKKFCKTGRARAVFRDESLRYFPARTAGV